MPVRKWFMSTSFIRENTKSTAYLTIWGKQWRRDYDTNDIVIKFSRHFSGLSKSLNRLMVHNNGSVINIEFNFEWKLNNHVTYAWPYLVYAEPNEGHVCLVKLYKIL